MCNATYSTSANVNKETKEQTDTREVQNQKDVGLELEQELWVGIKDRVVTGARVRLKSGSMVEIKATV